VVFYRGAARGCPFFGDSRVCECVGDRTGTRVYLCCKGGGQIIFLSNGRTANCRHVRDGCMEDAASAGKRVRAFRSIVRAQEYSLTRVFARMHTHTGSQLLDRAKQRYLRRLEQQNQKEV